ncbi:MAG: NAD(P)/FAD-dependent oxidoreductase [Burkholderiales bacterium]|nr:NAD(P)/FAD-dependent oxidoreductase [Burkholderiales bacterium]
MSLAALRERLAADNEWLAYPAKPWAAAPAGVLNCAIVGGGQFGLTIAWGLKRECVGAVRVFDRNPAGREGPWTTFARMHMLRTPKDLAGHDLGNAALTFRAWYEAQHGREAWQRLFRISRQDWQAYLGWYREVTGVDVQNETEVVAVAPPDASSPHFRLTVRDATGDRVVAARTVVFASGAEGSGGHAVPAFIAEALPAHLYAHTNDWPFDFARLADKRVGLIGAGASSFDTAIAALEGGAREAVLCFRRDRLPTANPRRWMEYAGFLAHYPELPDAHKWAYMQRLYALSQPPPQPTFERALALPGFRMAPATPWLAVEEHAGQVRVRTPGGWEHFDFVFAATGIFVDLAGRPEMAQIARHCAFWRDRYAPPPAFAEPRLGGFPYLGSHCEFTERVAGTAPWLGRAFTITRAATLSMGPSAASNSNVKYTAPRIVAGVTRALFLDEADAALAQFMSEEHHELAPAAVAAAQAQGGGE